MSKRIFKLLLVVACFFGVERFCHYQTDGFRFYEVLSDIPNDPSWEISSLTSTEQSKINEILDQPFSYLGGGGQCYAFVSQDGSYVLKLFRHSHLAPENLLKTFTLPFSLDRYRNHLYWHINRLPWLLFPSCKLAYEKLQVETGVIFIHLNKTKDLFPKIKLIDKCGISHQLDPNATEFVIQKKAEPLFPTLEKKIQAGEGKEALSALFSCILNCSRKGIRDKDNAIRRNFGYLGKEAVAFDIGSFVVEEGLASPTESKKELEIKTYRVKRWLRKHHPSFLPVFDEEMKKAMQSYFPNYLE